MHITHEAIDFLLVEASIVFGAVIAGVSTHGIRGFQRLLLALRVAPMAIRHRSRLFLVAAQSLPEVVVIDIAAAQAIIEFQIKQWDRRSISGSSGDTLAGLDGCCGVFPLEQRRDGTCLTDDFLGLA